VAPRRFAVLLVAAGSVAAAGRLWVSALTPEERTFVTQVEPRRATDDRPLVVVAAPDVLRSAVVAPRRAGHALHQRARVRATPVQRASAWQSAPARTTISFRPAAPSRVRPTHRAAPSSPPSKGHSPAPAPSPKPVPKPGPAPVPTPVPTPVPPAPAPPTPAPPTPAPPTQAPPTQAPPTQAPPVVSTAQPPPITVDSQPPPAPVTEPVTGLAAPVVSTRPGHGYGDANHDHTGPPGHAKP
jgi:hypothetical protein